MDDEHSVEQSPTLDHALNYAAKGFRIFPCQWAGPGRKAPLTPRGLLDASNHPDQIKFWWRNWSSALIGFATGHDRALLDIDIREDKNGFETLKALGFSDLPTTPTVKTPSGGYHLHFALPNGVTIRNTQGATGSGIGRGLDWRGMGGYAFLPSPESGYSWVEGRGEDVPLAAIPEALLPRVRERPAVVGTAAVCTELTEYGAAALISATKNIIEAPNGEQEATLNRECFGIGTAVGAGLVPAQLAFNFLLEAANAMPSYDPSRPWTANVLIAKTRKGFRQGMANPRPDAAAVEEAQWQRIANADESWWESRDAG